MYLSYPKGPPVVSTGGSFYLVRIATLQDAMTGPQKTKESPIHDNRV